ncbi:MAG: hypothetical protein RIC12_00315 [Pirellulales bacterium]
MLAVTGTYRYCVDECDSITQVSEMWLAFARENGAPQLTSSYVVGKSLWDFVAVKLLRDLYSAVHAKVRAEGQPAVIQFRCDSPSLRRHMRMTIRSLTAGHLEYSCVLLQSEPQAELKLIDVQQSNSEEWVTMCSICKRGLLESIGWLEAIDFATRLRLFEKSELPRVRHNLCPSCAKSLEEIATNGNAA